MVFLTSFPRFAPSTRNRTISCRRTHTHTLPAHATALALPVIRPPPTPARAPSIFNGAAWDKLEAAAVQSKVMMLIRNLAREPPTIGWLARIPVPVSLLSSSLPLPLPSQILTKAWPTGCGLTYRRGCCASVLLPCQSVSQSQCSSHEAVPVASSSHPLRRHHGFPRTDSTQRPPRVPISTSHLPMPG